MTRLGKLLKMNGQELYDAGQGHDWDLTMFLAQSRSFMRHLPAWKFWPQALVKWRGFKKAQTKDRERREACRSRT